MVKKDILKQDMKSSNYKKLINTIICIYVIYIHNFIKIINFIKNLIRMKRQATK